MKSYIQGLITGSVLVFVCVVLMGQKKITEDMQYQQQIVMAHGSVKQSLKQILEKYLVANC